MIATGTSSIIIMCVQYSVCTCVWVGGWNCVCVQKLILCAIMIPVACVYYYYNNCTLKTLLFVGTKFSEISEFC